MKMEIQDCFSVLFLFIGHSSMFHQGMKDNKKKNIVAPREKMQILFLLANDFLLTAKEMMKCR